GHLRRHPGGLARELAQRGGDQRRGPADDDLGGVAAALRGQGPGRGRGIGRAARDGGPGTAGTGRVPAARLGPGHRSLLGSGGRLPRGSSSVRFLSAAFRFLSAAFVRILSRVIIPLTGVQYEIEGGHYRATVTELGAG